MMLRPVLNLQIAQRYTFDSMSVGPIMVLNVDRQAKLILEPILHQLGLKNKLTK